MTTFRGYSSVGRLKKFTLEDDSLVRRSFLNALNIRQGEIPGRPDYGTTLWDFVFDNQRPELQTEIRNEIERVAAQDPRISISGVNFFPAGNGIRIEVTAQVLPSSTVELINIFFDQETRSARNL